MNFDKPFDMTIIYFVTLTWSSQFTYIPMLFYIWPTAFALTFYWRRNFALTGTVNIWSMQTPNVLTLLLCNL